MKHHGVVIADIPAKKLTDEAPLYHRDAKEPEYLKAVRGFRLEGIPGDRIRFTGNVMGLQLVPS